jgi:hypothetical protein
MQKITSLDLSYNFIRADGAAHIAKMPKITSLKLTGNSIGAAGYAALTVSPHTWG